MSVDATEALQRIDRWLWFARLCKSRTQASRIVEESAVRITRSGETMRTDKPSFLVKAGDVLTLNLRQRVKVLEILNCGTRRGPAKEAQALYRDLSSFQAAPSASGDLGTLLSSPDSAPEPGTRRTG